MLSRKALLAGMTALAGSCLSASATASDKINLQLGGFSKWWVVGAWSSPSGPTVIAASLNDAVYMTGQVGAAIEQRTESTTDETGLAAGSEPTGWSVWTRAVGGKVSRDATDSALGYQLATWGMVWGADTHVSAEMEMGGAFSWSRGFTNSSNGLAATGTRVDSYQITGYGAWTHGAWRVSGEAGVGLNAYQESRDLPGQSVGASFTGSQYTVTTEASYAVPFRGTVVSPTAGLRWLHLDTEGYQENGGGVTLAVDSNSQEQVESQLGFKVAWPRLVERCPVKPEVKAAWVHDFVNGNIATTGSLGGASFVGTGALPEADGAVVGAGLTVQASDSLSVRAQYDGQFRTDYRAHTGLIEVDARF